MVRATLRRDGGGAVGADAARAERAAGVPGVDLGVARQLDQALQRAVEILRALARLDRQVGPSSVADQERIAGQEVALDEVAAVLGPVAGCVQDANRERADLDILSVLDGIEWKGRLGERMNAHRRAVLERQSAVPGDVVGVRVGLEHADDPHACPFGLLEVGLDRVGGIHEHRLAGCLVADQVGRAAEVVVHKLSEQHVSTTLPISAASFLEVSRGTQRALVGAGAVLVAGLVAGAVALTRLDSGHGSLVETTRVKPAEAIRASSAGRAGAGAGGRDPRGRAGGRAGSATDADGDGARLERRCGVGTAPLVSRGSRFASGTVLRARLLHGLGASGCVASRRGRLARPGRRVRDSTETATCGRNRRPGCARLQRSLEPRLRRVAPLGPEGRPAHHLAPQGAE